MPTLAVLILVPVLISLGFWQLQRGEFKRERRELYEARSVQSPQRLSPVLIDAETFEYTNLIVKGEYESERQFLLDNQVLDGAAGYHVITPLKIDGGDTRILVNRGWVPWGPDRRQLPDVTPPAGIIELQGTAYVPTEEYFTLEDKVMRKQWHPVWQNMDLQIFSDWVDYPVEPVILLLSPAVEVGGYVRRWPEYRDH